MKIVTAMLLLSGLASLAFASFPTAPASVPEIGPASAVGALTLLSGALLVIRGRRKK